MGRTRGARTKRKPPPAANAALREEFLDILGLEEENTLPPAGDTRVIGARLSIEDAEVVSEAARVMSFAGAGDLVRAIVVAYVVSGELPGARELAAKAREVRS